MTEQFVWFSIVTPQWRHPSASRTVPVLGGRRRWFRYEVVESTRPVVRGGIEVLTHAHHSLHWTHKSAWKTAAELQRQERQRREGATP